eukprot:scaffold2557_cov121-Cylindrotheca_fusiformis.AAC.33
MKIFKTKSDSRGSTSRHVKRSSSYASNVSAITLDGDLLEDIEPSCEGFVAAEYDSSLLSKERFLAEEMVATEEFTECSSSWNSKGRFLAEETTVGEDILPLQLRPRHVSKEMTEALRSDDMASSKKKSEKRRLRLRSKAPPKMPLRKESFHVRD